MMIISKVKKKTNKVKKTAQKLVNTIKRTLKHNFMSISMNRKAIVLKMWTNTTKERLTLRGMKNILESVVRRE
eukprot:5237433-Heterocapsa_arctica.AAC.1